MAVSNNSSNGPLLPGRWKKKPKLDPNRFAVTKSGGGKWVARAISPGGTANLPRLPSVNQTVPDYNAPFRDLRASMSSEFDRQSTATAGYGDSLKKWLESVVAPLQAGNQAAQESYLNSIKSNTPATGIPGGPSIQSPSGGMVATPFTYLNQAATTQGLGQGEAATAQSGIDALLNKNEVSNAATGIYGNLANALTSSQSGINQRKTDYLAKLDEIMAQNTITQQQDTLKNEQFNKELALQQADSNRDWLTSLMENDIKLAGLDLKKLGIETTADTADENRASRDAQAEADRASREEIARLNRQNQLRLIKARERAKAEADPADPEKWAKRYDAAYNQWIGKPTKSSDLFGGETYENQGGMSKLSVAGDYKGDSLAVRRIYAWSRWMDARGYNDDERRRIIESVVGDEMAAKYGKWIAAQAPKPPPKKKS